MKLFTAVLFTALLTTGAAAESYAQDSKPATQGDGPDYSQDQMREVGQLNGNAPRSYDPYKFPSKEYWIKQTDLWRKAADRGSLLAEYVLAIAYRGELTKGLKKDDKEAMEWLQKAADQGYAAAQYDMAVAYHKGLWGIKKDDQEAFKWLQKAADQGDADALLGLGAAYYHGWGVKKDSKEAANRWRQSAEKGNFQASYFLRQYAGAECSSKTESASWAKAHALDETFANDPRSPYTPTECGLWAKASDNFWMSYAQLPAELDMYRKAAEQGNVLAQYALGTLYSSKANGVDPPDEKQAVTWYRKAADQGYSPAQNDLGDAYHGGQGVEKDEKEAVSWWLKAADQGNASAQYSLANAYHDGVGIGKDDKEAVKWWRKVAEYKDDDFSLILGTTDAAAIHLGDAYHKGEGVGKDMKEAVKWWRQAANGHWGGYLEAQYDLFRVSRGDTDFGETSKAMVDALRKKAEQGNAMDQLSLGLDYYEGIFVEKDFKEAEKWWRKSAEQGNVLAQYFLGYGNGTGPHEKQAIDWLRKAAEQGYAPAEVDLGYEYSGGNEGDNLKRDDKQALYWWRKSADQGYAYGQRALGGAYQYGLGVQKDNKEAVKWYQKAADQNFPVDMDFLKEHAK